MTLPTGQISMSQVSAELQFGLNLNLNNGSVRGLASRPDNYSTISMSQLRGKSNKPPSTFDPAGVSSIPASLSAGSAGSSARVSLTLSSNGTWSTYSSSGGSKSGRWIPGANGSDYEVAWTITPGTNYAGGINATGGYSSYEPYFSLSSNWILSALDADSETYAEDQATVTIRNKWNTADSTSFTIYMYADGRCFAVGTMLRTPFGGRTVESFVEGDIVTSFYEPTMIDESTDGWRDWTINNLVNVETETAMSRVRHLRRFTENQSIKINGIHSTLSHVYFVYSDKIYMWKEAKDILTTDLFIDSEKNLVPITSIEHVTEPTEFVAVNVEDVDTLQVKMGDRYILTHNISA